MRSSRMARESRRWKSERTSGRFHFLSSSVTDAGASQATPFHGYVYRLLVAQGPSAPGGAYQYVVNDKMLGCFGLIAFPAEYGKSGIMTFIVNHDGVVYSKDLGADTAAAVRAIQTFDPDRSWQRERSID